MPLSNTASIPAPYPMNGGIVNAIMIRQLPCGFWAALDGLNLRLGQLTVPVVSSVVMAALLCCISVVVRLGSKAQMVWINARRVVARMHHYKSVRNRAFKMFIRVAMSTNLNLAGQQEDAVSVSILCSSPKPAGRRFIDAPKEALLLSYDGIIGKCSGFSRSVVTGAAKSPANGIRTFANYTRYFPFNLVSHGGSYVGRPLYAITME